MSTEPPQTTQTLEAWEHFGSHNINGHFALHFVLFLKVRYQVIWIPPSLSGINLIDGAGCYAQNFAVINKEVLNTVKKVRQIGIDIWTNIGPHINYSLDLLFPRSDKY